MALPSDGGAFFEARSKIPTFTSGCHLLDLVLGGGWALNRIANIVGNNSTGKTLLAIEACANYGRLFPSASIWYAEAEAAFDVPYASALGLPEDRVEFVEGIFTVEDLIEDLQQKITHLSAKKEQGLYIVDSLDALSDRAELGRKIGDPTFGASKAKAMSELFRRLNKLMSGSSLTLIIISQERDNVGVVFGDKSSRSGGRALDFYASQIIFLDHLKRIELTKLGVSRPVGIRVQARNTKNKVGRPFRKCQFPIFFDFGVEDVRSMIEWLVELKQHRPLFNSLEAAEATAKQTFRDMKHEDWVRWRAALVPHVTSVWETIESGLSPAMRKYQSPES